MKIHRHTAAGSAPITRPNRPKLVGYAQSLSKPALAVGRGAVSLIIELFAIFVLVLVLVLVLLLLLEGPKMRSWTLGQMSPGRRATVTRIAGDVSQKVTGYMFGDLLTSLIAGTVVFVRLLILGVPFPLLWGLWVALVDTAAQRQRRMISKYGSIRQRRAGAGFADRWVRVRARRFAPAASGDARSSARSSGR